MNNYRNWYFFTLLYLVVDYGRPQDLLPIGFLMPGMVVTLLLAGFLVTSKANKMQFNIKQIRMIWLFIGLLGLFIPFAMNNYFAYLTTKNMLLFMPFILSATVCINTIDRLKKTIFVLICLMIYISFFSLLHKGSGSGSYFKDENDLSLFINIWLPFCLFLLMIEREKSKKIVYSAGLAIGVATNVISFSRGGFVGMVCIAVVAWFFSSRKVLTLVLLCLIALVVFFYAGEAYWDRISTAGDTQQGTARERLESWETAWKMFLDNPLGVGGNNFQVRFPEYQTDYFLRGMWGRVAHSLWFTLIPELGIAGILIYLLLMKYNLRDIFELKNLRTQENRDLLFLKYLSYAYLAAMAGYFSSGSFISVLYYPHYWYLTALIAASIKIAHSMRNPTVAAEPETVQPARTRSFR